MRKPKLLSRFLAMRQGESTIPYFAYGSNIRRARLEARVSVVSKIGNAYLPDYRFICDKPGQDNTGKANIIDWHGDGVWGLSTISPSNKSGDWIFTRANNTKENTYKFFAMGLGKLLKPTFPTLLPPEKNLTNGTKTI